MVQALINISERANRILTIVKAKYGLRDKSQAIDRMAQEYENDLLEPGLRPEYEDKLKMIEKEPRVKVRSFAKHFRLKA